ncbi:histone acetyltransferase HAC1 isoform X2 [Cryptomeria japonica]|uniref:histone acetyltransferase HAC1 isoform X2 n=1 Tax=Cryptomeria japonica TaxID=3369 RepID=UPI0025AC39D3|nr:histone acetyltransferase HAC1 isoform X2 [Cryptomeria japonica]
MDFSDTLNTGNLSPMSPTPVGDFSYISTIIPSAIPQDPVDVNRTFLAFSRPSIVDANDEAYLNPRVLNNRHQSQQKIGVVSMDTPHWTMPIKAGVYHGVGSAIGHPINAFQVKDNQVNGAPNGHMLFCGNGQTCDTMRTKMEKKPILCADRSTSTRMQWTGNDLHPHAPLCGKMPLSMKYYPNSSHQQKIAQSDISSKGNSYNHTSSGGPADSRNSCQKSIGWHSSKIIRSQQIYLQQQQAFEKQQPYLQLYQQPHLQPYQREQKNSSQQHQQRWQSCQQQNSHPQLGYQHLQNHPQQSLLNNNGIKPAHTSKLLWGKHTSDLSNQEPLHQEYRGLLQPQTKEMIQPGNLPTASESRGQWLDQNTQNKQFHLQHNQNLQHSQPLIPGGQLQIQSQNDSVGFPSEVQQKDGLQDQQESKPQEKNLFLHQIQCLEKQIEVDKHFINMDQMNRHQHSWPQLPPNDELIATLNTKNSDSTSTGDTEVSRQSSDVTEEQQNEYFKGKNELLGNATQCLVVEDKCQAVNYSPSKILSAEMIKFPTQCLPLTTVSHQQDSCDNCCPVSSPVCQKFPQESYNSLNQNIIDIKDDTTCHVGTNFQCVNNLSLEDQTKVFVNEGQIQEPPLKKSKLEPASSSDVKKHIRAGRKLNKVQLMFEQQPNGGKTNDNIPSTQKDGVFKSSKQTDTTAKTDLVANLQQSIPERHAKYKNVGEAKDAQEERECSQAASEFNSIASSKYPPLHRQEENQVKLKAPRMTCFADSSFTTKLVRSKLKGISLTEFFTPEQIRDHVAGLRQSIFQDKGNTEYNQFMEHQVDENACQLCTAGELKFQPPPIYCTSCGARIKRNAMYYTAGVGVTRNYFCVACFDKMQDCAIGLDGVTYLKSKLDKRKNSEEIEEGWVQCCKCKIRQHQICALFNARRIENDHADYICPNCYIKEIERGERKPLLQSAVLSARDLPKTYLSNHIEKRLSRCLKQERKERATSMGKSYEEVPGADALVVRVVSSVDKKVEVKQNFLEIVRDEGYPSEFPYKSKVLLLFQKINGVDVCLFSVYVQEFGSECSHPNQRRISLSYLDSVKYFRPDVKAVTGESLRTFVYHEILIGYLDYCKRRGFTSCYIWACPPIKGEDYILYCHPPIQKTPKCDKLREWYLKMLSKATEENIVLDVTNFYDYFFTSADECKARVTITRLPYFDGDYWPGAIEDMIFQLEVGDENFRKQQKKSKSKRNTTDWISHGAPQTGLPDSFPKDTLLMQKESALAMKDDFIMVHMHHSCSHCRLFILSGKRWVCNQCVDFQICDKCYETEEKLDRWDRHPTNSKEKHVLVPNDVTDIPTDTEDKDEIMESEFFDTRQAFLSLCQGNHYQYDTLRRAKHSSMMILYHLHNPAAPAFASTCNVCERDIETGQGWRCDTCVDFDICRSCYHNDKFLGHPHKLIAHPSIIEYNAQNREARQQRIVQLRKMLDLMVHASRCYSSQCQYPNCRKVKGLFRHGTQCKIRASGGCPHCKKMWYLIQLHGRACKESKCRVPHCKDLKEHFRRLQQQMESRRRAAVMEMMRQRAEDASSKCS